MNSSDRVAYPPAASEGDEVAVVAPSGSVAAYETALERGLSRLESLGVEPVVYDTATRDDDYLRRNPKARAEDVMVAFESDAKAVFAGVGGDDQLRILRHIEPDRLRANPTRFFGVSDNANLHCYLWNLGVVSFYGGQFVPGLAVDDELPDFTEEYLRRALFAESLGDLRPAERWSDAYYRFDSTDPHPWTANDGWTWHVPDARDDREPVRGRLWGGRLEVLTRQLQTDRYVPDDALDGCVLALETSEELPSATDVRRFLTRFGERGLLERFAAVLVGRPKTQHGEPESDEERRTYRKNQRETIRATLSAYAPETPAVFGLDFGHTDPHAPIPLGGDVVVDAEERSISFPA